MVWHRRKYGGWHRRKYGVAQEEVWWRDDNTVSESPKELLIF